MPFPSKRKRKKEEPPPTPNPPISSPKPSPTPESNPFLSLPSDLLLNCVARVSRLYYPTLSLVCKSFRSLLASPELYKARSLLNHTEICLYVCISSGSASRWYTLCRKPDKIRTKSKSTGFALARVSIPKSPLPSHFEGLVAAGSSIYQIAQWGYSNVSVLDCRSHTWREAPSFPVKLSTCSASVVDQKIYVAGRYGDGDTLSNLFKVFDTETQIWDSLPIPCTGKSTSSFYVYGTECFDGKFHTMTSSEMDIVYNSKEGRWDMVRSGMREYMHGESYCVIENVLYSASHGEFRWYDCEAHRWRKLNGLVGVPKLRREHWIRLADYGGKMVVFWKQDVPCRLVDKYLTKVWCAQISLERRQGFEIWGNVEWLDPLLTSSWEGDLLKVLAVSL